MRKYVLALIAALLVVGFVSCGKKEPPKPKAIYANLDVKHRGVMRIMLYPDKAPVAVKRFVKMSKEGFYDGLRFWWISADGLVQTGCSNNNGTGYYRDPKTGGVVVFKEEIDTSLHHVRGTVSMLNFNKPMTTSSQFLICRKAVPKLDGKYTIIGEIVNGLAVLDSIDKNDTIGSLTIEEMYE